MKPSQSKDVDLRTYDTKVCGCGTLDLQTYHFFFQGFMIYGLVQVGSRVSAAEKSSRQFVNFA